MNRESAECFDAVVIGGGPAGSVAAIALAQLGWRAMLIERRARHQGKTCGHCLSARAIMLLKLIGLPNVINTVSVGETHAMHAHTAEGTLASLPPATFPARSIITPRHLLDQQLIDAAQSQGVTVAQPANARINRADMTVQITPARKKHAHPAVETIQAPLIIGADGLRSRVAGAFGMVRRALPGRKFGFSMRAPLTEAGIAASGIDPGAVHMFISPHGYLGLVREGRHIWHCAGLVQRKGMVRDPRAFCTMMKDSFPQLCAAIAPSQDVTHQQRSRADERVSAAGPMPWRPTRIAGPNVALVGDAAGYVEPFTGEGMSWAIDSALALAEVCSHIAPGGWTMNEARQYETLWRERINRRQQLCRMVAGALEFPWLQRVMLRSGALQRFVQSRISRRVLAA